MHRLNIPLSLFIDKLLAWGKQFSHFALFPGNEYPDAYHQYDLLFAAGAKQIIQPEKEKLDSLYGSWEEKPSWLFGYIGYDIKNELEKLSSKNRDELAAPDLQFFEPEIVGWIRNGDLHIEANSNSRSIWAEIQATAAISGDLPQLNFRTWFSREGYLQRVRQLQAHIQRGDIYEINFCQEFYAAHAEVDPALAFSKLNEKARPPFAAFLNLPQTAVICASPERYLQKIGDNLVSQPIKGTAKRSHNQIEDQAIQKALHASEKERAENVMIVDLVRNDLSRVAAPRTVDVPELFGVHTFPTVHQLISTVTAKLDSRFTWVDALKASFPMGSMTGAPKFRAMELIEAFEAHKRGIYSGAVGYITPQGDFDFNVVIRTLLYNKPNKYLSASVGGAITIQADPKAEYAECMLKAEALLNLFH
jgi:para-aminobenzoate synthetase component 1